MAYKGQIVYVTHLDPIDQINPTLHCNRNTKHDNDQTNKYINNLVYNLFTYLSRC